jgi:predicted short-subunit dehydrogenase-like oxidoreductase (DUF2520 family)
MGVEFTILGRGHAGRALAEAWGDRVALLDHGARPEGLVLLAVPDRAVPALSAHFPGRCVHLAGSLHLPEVPCAHPLTSFDGRARDWRGTPLALTGAVPDPVRRAFGDLGFAAFDLPAELKPLYHAAAVLSSGHAATLWLGAEALLRAQGVALPGRGLLPLAEATLRNVAERGAEGRTGPFARGDEESITRDAEALPEAWREIFLKLGRCLR